MQGLPTSSKYWSEAEGRAVVDAWRQSGEQASRFARRHGLKAKRIMYWSERLSRAERGPAKLSLVPAAVVAPGAAVVIRVGDVVIELSSATPDQVAAIAQALARRSP